MKLVTYNIHYGVGWDGVEDLERIANAVRGADVIALQEVERNYGASGPADQPAALEALLPDYYWVYGPAFDVDASERGADGRVVNRRCQHGVMLMSKWPILSCRPLVLPKVAYGDRFNMFVGALEGVIESPLGPSRVYGLHLGYLEAEERLRQLDYLLAFVRVAPSQGGAWCGPAAMGERDWSAGRPPPPMPENAVLLGDFNMVPDSCEYALVTDAQEAGAPGFVDAWVAAGKGEEPGHSWVYPTDQREGPDRRIDYCFLCPALAERVRDCWVDTAAKGSDHQPVWVELEV
jgi:endonuclease/exonuclease/phosphatase family metal-dependent hydrolase